VGREGEDGRRRRNSRGRDKTISLRDLRFPPYTSCLRRFCSGSATSSGLACCGPGEVASVMGSRGRARGLEGAEREGR
jgi:hypothetical protein